jgi:hypothetical protein
MIPDLNLVVNLIQNVGIAATAVGLVMGFFEYRRQGRHRRAEKYFELVKEFEKFDEILDLLRNDSPKLKKLRASQRERFLNFYEDLALMLNSGLIQEHLALYSFGYWLQKAWDSKHFWHDPQNKENGYWFLSRQLHFRFLARQKGFQAFVQAHNRSEAYGKVKRAFRF